MKRDINKKIKQTLSKQHVCYVLITCDKPSESGEMQVEMTYNGDATVAAYLLHGAQSYMNEQEMICSVNQNQDQKIVEMGSLDTL